MGWQADVIDAGFVVEMALPLEPLEAAKALAGASHIPLHGLWGQLLNPAHTPAQVAVREGARSWRAARDVAAWRAARDVAVMARCA